MTDLTEEGKEPDFETQVKELERIKLVLMHEYQNMKEIVGWRRANQYFQELGGIVPMPEVDED